MQKTYSFVTFKILKNNHKRIKRVLWITLSFVPFVVLK